MTPALDCGPIWLSFTDNQHGQTC